MGERSLAWSLAFLASAGCLAPATPVGPFPPPEPFAWGLEGCRFLVSLVPVLGAPLQDRTPPGFRLRTPEEVGFPPGVPGDAVLLLQAWRCAAALGPDGARDPDASYAALTAYAEPPPELRVPGTTALLKWDTLLPPALRGALGGLGLPLREGSVTLESPVGRSASAAPVHAAIDFGGGESWSYGHLPGIIAPNDFRVVEYSPVDAGLVVWTYHLRAPNSRDAPGALEGPETGWARDALFPVPGAYVEGGTGEVLDGQVRVLPIV